MLKCFNKYNLKVEICFKLVWLAVQNV